jgi:hypothetical protein
LSTFEQRINLVWIILNLLARNTMPNNRFCSGQGYAAPPQSTTVHTFSQSGGMLIPGAEMQSTHHLAHHSHSTFLSSALKASSPRNRMQLLYSSQGIFQVKTSTFFLPRRWPCFSLPRLVTGCGMLELKPIHHRLPISSPLGAYRALDTQALLIVRPTCKIHALHHSFPHAFRATLVWGHLFELTAPST